MEWTPSYMPTALPHTRYEHGWHVGAILVVSGVPEGRPAHRHHRLVCAGTVASHCHNVRIHLVYIHLERRRDKTREFPGCKHQYAGKKEKT